MYELTVAVALLVGIVLLLALGARWRRWRRRRETPLLPARHLKHRDPYAPLHHEDSPAERWLRGDYDRPDPRTSPPE